MQGRAEVMHTDVRTLFIYLGSWTREWPTTARGRLTVERGAQGGPRLPTGHRPQNRYGCPSTVRLRGASAAAPHALTVGFLTAAVRCAVAVPPKDNGHQQEGTRRRTAGFPHSSAATAGQATTWNGQKNMNTSREQPGQDFMLQFHSGERPGPSIHMNRN